MYLICFLQIVLLLLLENNGIEIRSRIVGGEEADIQSYPYMASVMYQNRHICGGSIISKKYVLTAAHCCKKKFFRYFSIRVGSSISENYGTIYSVCSILTHENYFSALYGYDIALIKVCLPFKYSSAVRPIKLFPKNGITNRNSMATVTGWGFDVVRTTDNDLREVDIQIFPGEYCKRIFHLDGFDSNLVCAGSLALHKDACQGDSGGPLVIENKQLGIVSFGEGCGRLKIPGVYTNVTFYLDWIYKRIKNK